MNAPIERRRLLLGSALAATLPRIGQASEEMPPLLQPRSLQFPRDHGSHPDTRTEWWYLTGHASDARGRSFGFQVTFFRSRVPGTHQLPGRLAAKHLVFAHAAITDVQGGKLWHDQRIARWNGALPNDTNSHGAVFASEADTDVALHGWRLQRDPNSGKYRAQVAADDMALQLTAKPTQPWLLQGDNGFSRKGPNSEQASFYVSHPQLDVTGSLRVRGDSFTIKQGQAWLDHEWSQALLHPDAVGWDWIGMNLFNGDSLTAFRLRRADGSALWAGGSLRSAADISHPSSPRSFGPTDVAFVPQREWTSPLTRANYPVEWRVQTPAGNYTVKAVLDAQELDSRTSTGTVYWEGLSDLFDGSGQRVGRGYLEMTGYVGRLVL